MLERSDGSADDGSFVVVVVADAYIYSIYHSYSYIYYYYYHCPLPLTQKSKVKIQAKHGRCEIQCKIYLFYKNSCSSPACRRSVVLSVCMEHTKSVLRALITRKEVGKNNVLSRISVSYHSFFILSPLFANP
jgi:hypothetical protein